MVDAFQVKILANGRKNIIREKQTINKVPLMFYMLKFLPKSNNSVFAACQEASNYIVCI